MTDIFKDGQESSASTLTKNMSDMISTGQQIVDTMEELRVNSLLQVQRDLNRLQGYGCQAARAPRPGVAASFLVSDFINTDQTRTNATVRADSASVTLRERKNPGNVTAKSTTFSSNTGTVESFGSFFRVTADTLPVGTFDIELEKPSNISLIIIDFAPTPSIPNVKVKVSTNGITYTDAKQVTTSGYRASIWLNPQEVRYVQIAFSPTHQDTLGSGTYTFGINDFYAYTVEFQLQSDWFSLPALINPTTYAWTFKAPSTPGLLYFISFDGEKTWQEVTPGQEIPVPGAIKVNVQANLPSTLLGAPNTSYQLDQSIPNGTIISTILLLDSSGAEVPMASGLALGAIGLSNQYVTRIGFDLFIQPFIPSLYGNVYTLSYVYIPVTT